MVSRQFLGRLKPCSWIGHVSVMMAIPDTNTPKPCRNARFNRGVIDKRLPTGTLTASLPLKNDRNPKGKDHLPTMIFQRRAVKHPGCKISWEPKGTPPRK